MIDLDKNPSGQLFDLFSESELDSWVEYLKKLPPIFIRENYCHGVDEKNIHNMWFHKMIYRRIQDMFGTDIMLQFGMFLNENKPWSAHTDAYHVKPFPDRESAISILLPYSVDGDKNLVEKSRTIVFNERLPENTFSSLPEVADAPNSALTIFQEHLSHNKEDVLKRLTIKEQYQWKLGSLIYWDSLLIHDSDNFLSNGYLNKQAIVIHTYRRKSN